MFSRMLIVVLAMASSHDLAAQVAEQVAAPFSTAIVRRWDRLEGSRIRINDFGASSSMDLAVEGTLVSARADSLFLRVEGRDALVAVLAGPGTRVEEWRREDPTKAYVLAGALVGSVAGGVIASLVNRSPPKHECPGTFDSPAAAIGCAIGANVANSVEEGVDRIGAVLLGAGIGAALGVVGGRHLARSRVTEGWRPVTLRRLGVRPGFGGGVHVGLELTF